MALDNQPARSTQIKHESPKQKSTQANAKINQIKTLKSAEIIPLQGNKYSIAVRPFIVATCFRSRPMRQLVLIALASAAQVLAMQPVPAQAQANRYVAEFEKNIANGCFKNFKNPKKENWQYCKCYAKEFVKRYNANELRTITKKIQNLNNSGAATQLVAAMTSPERRMCRSLSSLSSPN